MAVSDSVAFAKHPGQYLVFCATYLQGWAGLGWAQPNVAHLAHCLIGLSVLCSRARVGLPLCVCAYRRAYAWVSGCKRRYLCVDARTIWEVGIFGVVCEREGWMDACVRVCV